MQQQPVLTFLLANKGLSNIAFGVALIIMPNLVFDFLGVGLGVGGTFVAELFGAALLGIGLTQFMGRNLPHRRQDVGAYALADLLGLIIVIMAMASGLMNALGWVIAALYALAAGGFGYAYIKEFGRN